MFVLLACQDVDIAIIFYMCVYIHIFYMCIYTPNCDICKSFEQQSVSILSVDAMIDIERHYASVSKVR